jgi:hypothetical protein
MHLAADDGTTDLTGTFEPINITIYKVVKQCIAPVTTILHNSRYSKYIGEGVFSMNNILGNVTMAVTTVLVRLM